MALVTLERDGDWRGVPTQVLAALLAYRAIYFLVPLLLAVAGYALLELRGRAPGNVYGGS